MAWLALLRQKEFANMLAAAHGACLPQQKADNAAYDSTRGKNLIDQSRSITDVIAQVILGVGGFRSAVSLG